MVTEVHTTPAEELALHGTLCTTTSGDSMAPLFRTHRSMVSLHTPQGRAKRRDVILFHRPDGRYVMHRVVRVTEDGYITRGDNRRRNDAPVPEEQLLAVMDGYRRGKRFITTDRLGYRLYVFFWGMPNPLKFLLFNLRDFLRLLVGRQPKG